MYDFAVVGVGPAGARFARQAAAAGHDVIALEKGEIGTPLACSGHVSTDIWEYVPDTAESDLRQNVVRGAKFHVGGPGSRSYPFYKREAVSNVIDRVELDRSLAECARDAGADVREGYTVTGIEEQTDRVVLEVSIADGDAGGSDAGGSDAGGSDAGGSDAGGSDAGGSDAGGSDAGGSDAGGDEKPQPRSTGTETIAARMVAGCDGPVSRVRRSVGLPEPEETLHGVLAFDDEPDDSDFVDVHLTAPRFFAWRIPRGEAGVEYGLAAPPGEDVTDLFEALTDAYDVETDRFCSGAIPIGPPETITSERVFLIGDAAAQTKPFTGGGILYGMSAADIAADRIDPTDPTTLDAYENGWREELATEIRLGKLIRACYSLPEPVQHLGLRALSGEIGVHMDRPSSFFSREQLRRLRS